MFQNNPMVYFLTYRLGLQSALTQTTSREQACLLAHARGKNVLVEIGVWHGVNTRAIREAMAPDGRLYAIDPFPRGRFGVSWEKLIAVREAGKVRHGRLRFLEAYSHDADRIFDEIETAPLDFLFIDGDHSYEGVKKDWLMWSIRLAAGGVVALHDSRSHEGRQIDQTGSARFTRETVLHDPRFVVVDTCDSLTVLQRVAS